MSEYAHIQRLIATAEAADRIALAERLTEIFTERRIPGTRNGPITEPRLLAAYVVAKLAEADQ